MSISQINALFYECQICQISWRTKTDKNPGIEPSKRCKRVPIFVQLYITWTILLFKIHDLWWSKWCVMHRKISCLMMACLANKLKYPKNTSKLTWNLLIIYSISARRMLNTHKRPLKHLLKTYRKLTWNLLKNYLKTTQHMLNTYLKLTCRLKNLNIYNKKSSFSMEKCSFANVISVFLYR